MFSKYLEKCLMINYAKPGLNLNDYVTHFHKWMKDKAYFLAKPYHKEIRSWTIRGVNNQNLRYKDFDLHGKSRLYKMLVSRKITDPIEADIRLNSHYLSALPESGC